MLNIEELRHYTTLAVRWAAVKVSTNRKRDYAQIERHLKQQTRLIEQIAEAIPDILYVDDLVENRNVYINRRAAGILGYSQREFQRLAERRFQDIIHPVSKAHEAEWLQSLTDAPDSSGVENELR